MCCCIQIASSGLGYRHLQLAFKRGESAMAVSDVLKEKGADKKPRVTANRKVLDAVEKHFQPSQ